MSNKIHINSDFVQSKEIYHQLRMNKCLFIECRSGGSADEVRALLQPGRADPSVPYGAEKALPLVTAIDHSNKDATKVLLADPRTDVNQLDGRELNAVMVAGQDADPWALFQILRRLDVDFRVIGYAGIAADTVRLAGQEKNARLIDLAERKGPRGVMAAEVAYEEAQLGGALSKAWRRVTGPWDSESYIYNLRLRKEIAGAGRTGEIGRLLCRGLPVDTRTMEFASAFGCMPVVRRGLMDQADPGLSISLADHYGYDHIALAIHFHPRAVSAPVPLSSDDEGPWWGVADFASGKGTSLFLSPPASSPKR